MTQSLNSSINTSFASQKDNLNKETTNLFNKIQVLENYLEGIHSDIQLLNQQAQSVAKQKKRVEQYLGAKAQETRIRLMKQLNCFEQEIKKRIDNSKTQTNKIDIQIQHIKQIQLATIQMILALQRRTQQLEVQLGG